MHVCVCRVHVLKSPFVLVGCFSPKLSTGKFVKGCATYRMWDCFGGAGKCKMLKELDNQESNEKGCAPNNFTYWRGMKP